METNLNYDVAYFIKKFEAIPEEKMIAYYQCDEVGNRCAVGWCNVDKDYGLNIFSIGCITFDHRNVYNSSEVAALDKLIIDNGISEDYGNTGWAIAHLNNGDNPKYTQSTAKQRVLAALYDIKNMKQPKVKTIIKYVAVSEVIRNEVPATLEEVN